MDWLPVIYVALALATAEFLRRHGVNWLGQLIAGLAWPLYWGHCVVLAWQNRSRRVE